MIPPLVSFRSISMQYTRYASRHLVAKAVTLALLAAFVAEISLPAVVAAWGPEARAAVAVVEGHGSRHGSSDHHHPGCPWRGKGPCPHKMAADSARGPILTACAETPAAAADGAARLLLDPAPVLDWSLRPTVAGEPLIPLRVEQPVHDPSPETPPPRLSRAL
jgi:hypothetical protein